MVSLYRRVVPMTHPDIQLRVYLLAPTTSSVISGNRGVVASETAPLPAILYARTLGCPAGRYHAQARTPGMQPGAFPYVRGMARHSSAR